MMSLSPGSTMLITPVRKSLPQAVPSSTLLPVKWCTLVLLSIAWYSISLLRRGGQLLAMMMSFALELRRDFRVSL